MAGAPALAQNIKTATIVWNSVSTLNAANGDLKEEDQKITSHGSASIDWESSTGTETYEVQEVLGQWNTIASNGTITYEVKKAGKRGTFTFLRNGNETMIRILLVDNAEEIPVNVELKISNTQVQ